MSAALYERYKDALRRGHVAAQRGRTAEALEAYGEATRLAPDRALPLIGIGAVLTRLGKTHEALAAYEAALERAPADETALRARADLLTRDGDRIAAAATLDRLAAVLDAGGRHSEAVDAAAHGLELAESRSRRAGLRSLVERLAGDGAGDPAAADARSRADRLLRDPVPEEPPFDPSAATAAVEAAADRGDTEAMRGLALVAAAGHRAAGHIHAAIDVCYLALATDPADPDLHLALAALYLDRGWRTAAADKLVLLARLIELTEDSAARDRLCSLAAARLPDEPRLLAVCA